MIADEVWTSVNIYGRHVDIDRFRMQCIAPATSEDHPESDNTIDFSLIMPIEVDATHAGRQAYHAWAFPFNFRCEDEGPGEFRFAVDTDTRFPAPIFERLAEMFPTLAFHCHCIASDDSFGAYGWFNAPPGGESFAYCKVPENYWASGGGRLRGAIAQAQHVARVEMLKRAIREASHP